MLHRRHQIFLIGGISLRTAAAMIILSIIMKSFLSVLHRLRVNPEEQDRVEEIDLALFFDCVLEGDE